MTQPDLLSWTPPATDRHGSTYDSSRDFHRLNAQQSDVWNAIKDGEWHTLRELSASTGHPEASISARLRDIRALIRPKGWAVEREYVSRGLWRYRVTG